MSAQQIIAAIMLLDLILVPPLVIFIVAGNFLWIMSLSAKAKRFQMLLVFCCAIFIASTIGYLLISSSQTPKDKSGVIFDSGTKDEIDDCERHPGIYGC